jgi:hypothetical protein
MRPLLDPQDVLRELQAGISVEWSSGFPQLRRIPSTGVRKFIDYVARLDAGGRVVFAAALADGAFDLLYPESGKTPLYKRNEAYRMWADMAVHMTGQRYSSVRAQRATLRLADAELQPPPDPPRRPRMAYAKPRPLLSAARRQWISSIQPVTSADIRKEVKQALRQVMSSFAVTHQPGHLWEYSGEVQGVPLVISVNYASPLYAQFEYWVSVRDERTGLWGSNFERLMGLSGAYWDLLERANLEQSVAVLCDHIAYCAGFLWRLPPRNQRVDQPSKGHVGDAAGDA